MTQNRVRVLVLSFVLSFAVPAFSYFHPNQRRQPQSPVTLQPTPAGGASDSALVQAVMSGRRVNFVTGAGMKVIVLLPDDTSGSPHQKFIVQLSNGSQVTVISNLDMCPHIPVQQGDSVGAGGQFIPTGKGSGILHWTHRDPRKTRPDGYIELAGQVYCK